MKHGSTSVISSPPPLPPTIEGEHLLQLLKISLAGKEGKGSNSLPSHPIEIGHFKLFSYILQTLLNIQIHQNQTCHTNVEAKLYKIFGYCERVQHVSNYTSQISASLCM